MMNSLNVRVHVPTGYAQAHSARCVWMECDVWITRIYGARESGKSQDRTDPSRRRESKAYNFYFRKSEAKSSAGCLGLGS